MGQVGSFCNNNSNACATVALRTPARPKGPKSIWWVSIPSLVAMPQIADDPVTMINEFAVGEIVPDLTVVLDIPPEVGFERIKHRVSDMPDRMEQENIEFYGKVRKGYLHLARSLPERFFVVDGNMEADEIELEIWNEIHARFYSQE